MAQQITKGKPLYVVTDKSPRFLTENEASYIKNYRVTFNENANNAAEGGNLGVGTPNRSNKKHALITLPAGANQTIGVYECEETNEIYYANWNSNNLHGWYRIKAESLLAEIVIVDSRLNFSNDPAHKIPQHRVNITVVYERTEEKSKIVKEKYLKYTDGYNWQRFINVEAAVKTNGFDVTKFPYWASRVPHFDRDELIDLAVRPPMYAPVVSPIAPSAADIGKPNSLVDKSIQLAIEYELKDGRPTTASPYSNPIAIKQSSCDANNSTLPRCYNVVLNVGSCLVERIKVFAKQCGGDWYLYDTIERFGPSSDPNLDYWLRTNDWDGYGYDPATNTINYTYCGDRQLAIIDQDDFKSFQTDLPLLSIAMTAAGDSLLLGDSLFDYDNLPKIDIAKFKASIVDEDNSSVLKTRKITLYAYLAYNGSQNQFIYTNVVDKGYRFAGILYGSLMITPSQMKFETLEADINGAVLGESTGFLAYLAGTNYFAISKQYLVNPDGTMINQDVIDITNAGQKQLVIDLFNRGGYIVQKFDFIVPAGRYIARLARHGADTKGQYEKTSTFVLGQISKSKINGFRGIFPYTFDNTQLDTIDKELEIDVCNGDFDAWTAPNKNLFYIFVPYFFGQSNNNNDWRFIEGYVVEDEKNSVGVEALHYDRSAKSGREQYLRYGDHTDHNGYYFMYVADGSANQSEVVVFGIANCQPNKQIATTKIQSSGNTTARHYLLNISLRDNLGGYGDCNRVLLRGKIVDSVSGFGYSGIGITSTHGPTTYTASDGTFELAVHNGLIYNGNDRLYVNSGGGNGCLLIPESGVCMPIIPYTISGVPCINCQTRIYPTDFVIKVSVLRQAANSLKDGGRYGTGAVLFDLAGRSVFVQEFNYVDAPTFMEKGAVVLSKLQIELTEDVILPTWVKWLTFFRTKNLKVRKYLQWVGDKIEFLDKNGDVTPTGAGAIRARITIQSLLDFNVENNFSTTATYQFTQGDILRFYDDGLGNLFDPANGGLMDFPILGTNFNDTVQPDSVAVSTTANGVTTTTTTQSTENATDKTIIIPFDKRLLILNNIVNSSAANETAGCGFWIEIQTPSNTAQIDGFCEVVGTYPITDRVLKAQTFALDTFDTYYQTRSIHIKQCTGKAIIHPFAAASITDYFGLGCDSCGRISIKNPQAEQRWYPDDVIKSDDFVNEGRVNGLGRFRSKNRKHYKGREIGGIVGMHAQNKLIVFICENDWFMANFDLDVVQVGQDGTVVAPGNQILGEAFQKVNNKFGCALQDTGSIVLNDMDGVVFWADSKNEAIVVMDYQNATDISLIDNKSYFLDKFTFIRQFNQALPVDDRFNLNLFDISMGYDYKFKELHVSFRPRKGLQGDPQFFSNTEREKVVNLPETFTFSLDQKKWVQFQTFVPEFYGSLRKALSGNELISFVAGVPYFHNSKDVITYNNFYGVQDTQILEMAFVAGNKDKTFQALVIESPVVPYFVDRIITNNPKLISYIPISQFKRKKNIWYGSVLRDMASYPDTFHPVKSMLLDGGAKISGEFCVVRFVRDLSQMDIYNEVDGFFMQFIGLEKTK